MGPRGLVIGDSVPTLSTPPMWLERVVGGGTATVEDDRGEATLPPAMEPPARARGERWPVAWIVETPIGGAVKGVGVGDTPWSCPALAQSGDVGRCSVRRGEGVLAEGGGGPDW